MVWGCLDTLDLPIVLLLARRCGSADDGSSIDHTFCCKKLTGRPPRVDLCRQLCL